MSKPWKRSSAKWKEKRKGAVRWQEKATLAQNLSAETNFTLMEAGYKWKLKEYW
jgi:hypothetical protein